MDIVAPTSVYLYYDASDILIYVGITSRGIKRNVEHNTTKDWWRFVARQEVEHFDTRHEALAREKALIATHSPPFNTHHNPDSAKAREAYLLFSAAMAQPTEWKEEIKAAGMRLPLDFHDFGRGEHLTLRTRLEDASIAAAIRLDPDLPPPRALGLRKTGRVTEVEKVGPVVLFKLSSTRQHPLYDSWVFLKFHPKQRHLVIRHITTRMDHSNPRLCTSKCPQAKGAAA